MHADMPSQLLMRVYDCEEMRLRADGWFVLCGAKVGQRFRKVQLKKTAAKPFVKSVTMLYLVYQTDCFHGTKHKLMRKHTLNLNDEARDISQDPLFNGVMMYCPDFTH
jgi:hypothetical protein